MFLKSRSEWQAAACAGYLSYLHPAPRRGALTVCGKTSGGCVEQEEIKRRGDATPARSAADIIPTRG